MKNINFEKYIDDKKLNQLADFFISQNLPIFINGHINTDYDSICSCLTLAICLHKIGKNAKVIFSEDASILFDRVNIKGYENLITTSFNYENDYVGVLCDMNTTNRASCKKMFENASIKINIDHHDNNNMLCDQKYVDEIAGANSENILKLILIIENKCGIKILDKDICSLLCMGIITDTCNIEKSTNLSQTKWAIDVIKTFGVDINQIANLVYLNLGSEQQVIFEKTISSKQVFDKISYYYIDDKDIANIKTIHNDFSMVLSKILEIDHNPIILYEQRQSNQSVWEFRSNDIKNLPVNEVALSLGGGGHKNASGATIKDKDYLQVISAFNQLTQNENTNQM